MAFMDFFRQEERAAPFSLESQNSSFIQVLTANGTASLPFVTIESALKVPAVLSAVSFLSRILAGLPIHAYRSTKAGSEKISGGLQTIVHDAPNAEWTSFKLRQYFWQQVFTGGRGLLWIERTGTNIIGLWPINPEKVTIHRNDLNQTSYKVGDRLYYASDVIDISFMLKADGLSHFGPITQGEKAIQLALAMNDYGSSFFAGGGVPPLAVYGTLPTGPDAMKRATADIQRAIDAAKMDSKPIVAMPAGYELKPIGFDPDKGQMEAGRRFQVEEIARIFQLPPAFLQDLTHGTFSNVEQQSLTLVKFLIGQWAEAFEQELNLKLFGQRNNARFVAHNLEGLQRGDFVTRMNGLSQGIQSALITPNEARALENRPALEGGDSLMIQSATVPIQMTLQYGANADGTSGTN